MCAADSRPHLCSSIHKVTFSAAADGGSMPSFQKGSGSFLPYLPLGFCVWIVIITRPALGSRNLVCGLIGLECLSPVSTRGDPLRPPTHPEAVLSPLCLGTAVEGAHSSHLVMAGWGNARPREVMGTAVEGRTLHIW